MKQITLSYLLITLLLFSTSLSSCTTENNDTFKDGFRKPNSNSSKTQTIVFDYKPAPGQFINETEEIKTQELANSDAMERMEKGHYVSLGGFGGYIIVGFDHSIQNKSGYDFYIKGNAFDKSSEPGIVYVMTDTNLNGIPDDVWYQLKGSNHGDVETTQNYEVTYSKPNDYSDVSWIDNNNIEGSIDYLSEFHNQRTYYPTWIEANQYSLNGICLESNVFFNEKTKLYELSNLEWGYVDNFGTDYVKEIHANGFKIKNAIDNEGRDVNIDYIDFIKVQNAMNAKAGPIGETSTEVVSFIDARL